VTGPLAVTLFAASSARDTDFTAALVDVFPDGYAQLVQEGILRARYRDSDRSPQLLNPGEVYELTIDAGATSYVFAAGHALRLEVSSSNFGRFDRNLNTGRDFGVDDTRAVARQTIYHEAAYPSHMTLPLAEQA
jgi:uncharacterized protein